MSEDELQACLARIYVDEPFRLLSRLDPRVTIDRYDLSPHERSAILGLDSNAVDFFAASLRNRRRLPAEVAFPAIFKIDRSRAIHLWDRFYDLAGSIPHQSPDDGLLRFGTFLEESVANQQWPPYTSDLVAFEKALFKAVPAINQPSGDNDPVDRANVDTTYALADNVRLQTFRYDVFKLKADLANGVTPIDPEINPVHIVVIRHSDTRPSVFFKLNEPAMLALKNCNGHYTANDIALRIAAHYNGHVRQEDILRLVASLQSRGIIRRSDVDTE